MRIIIASLLLLTACGRHRHTDTVVVTPPPAVTTQPPAAEITRICGRDLLRLGQYIFIVNLTTGETRQVVEHQIYDGPKSCGWGSCYVPCRFVVVDGIPRVL